MKLDEPPRSPDTIKAEMEEMRKIRDTIVSEYKGKRLSPAQAQRLDHCTKRIRDLIIERNEAEVWGLTFSQKAQERQDTEARETVKRAFDWPPPPDWNCEQCGEPITEDINDSFVFPAPSSEEGETLKVEISAFYEFVEEGLCLCPKCLRQAVTAIVESWPKED